MQQARTSTWSALRRPGFLLHHQPEASSSAPSVIPACASATWQLTWRRSLLEATACGETSLPVSRYSWNRSGGLLLLPCNTTHEANFELHKQEANNININNTKDHQHADLYLHGACRNAFTGSSADHRHPKGRLQQSVLPSQCLTYQHMACLTLYGRTSTTLQWFGEMYC